MSLSGNPEEKFKSAVVQGKNGSASAADISLSAFGLNSDNDYIRQVIKINSADPGLVSSSNYSITSTSAAYYLRVTENLSGKTLMVNWIDADGDRDNS
jgi:hypothetical protein